MFRVYFDNNIQKLNDVININEVFQASIVREDGFSNDEQILREKSEIELSFCGASYVYLNDKIDDSRCNQVELKIVDDTCGLVHTGIIKVSQIENNPHKKTCKTKLYDNSFSAYLRDVINVPVYLYNTNTKNCLPLSTVQKDIVMYTNPANQTDTSTITGFDSLDIITYLVSFFSDNKVGVRSDYLTNNKFGWATGYSMHNHGVGINEIYPSVSIDQVFKEIRKKTTIYMSIEYDNGYYLRIEPEAYFFNNIKLFTIPGIPEGLIQTQDLERNFSEIQVGSDTTDVQDGTTIYYPQENYTAWNKESYPFCGTCAANKDSKLDLVSTVIIDSNLIYEALNAGGADYDNDDALFLFEYTTVAGIDTSVTTLDVNTGTYVYNISINNENVLNNWIDYVGKCVAAQRNAKYGFLLNRGLSEMILASVSGSGTEALDNKNLWSSIAYDNLNSISTGTLSGDDFNYFTCQENGLYQFEAKQNNLKQIGIDDGSTYFPNGGVGATDVTYTLRVNIYTDNTFSTLINTYEASEVAPNGYTDLVTLKVDTGKISLGIGNCALSELHVEFAVPNADTGFNIHFIADTMSFQLLSDSSSCLVLNDNNQNSRPFVIKFDYQICLDDYKTAQQNKSGYIEVGGLKWWIKEIVYRRKRNSSITLMGNINLR